MRNKRVYSVLLGLLLTPVLASAARTKGLKALVLRVPAKGACCAGAAITHLSEWTGEDGAEVNSYCEGKVGKRHVHDHRTFVFGRRRRSFTHVALLPDGLEDLVLRYDLVKFGRAGKFVFHGNRVGRYAELPPPRDPSTSAAPTRTFYATFVNTADAPRTFGAWRLGPYELRVLGKDDIIGQ